MTHNYTDQIAAVLDTIGDDTPQQVLERLSVFDGAEVSAVVVKRLLDVEASGNGGSRPFISDTETGIVVNRAGGFQSDWETFDVEQPGVGYGKATITAATADGETFDSSLLLEGRVEVSADGSTWVRVYPGAAGVKHHLESFAQSADPVGTSDSYVVMTPRYIRFALAILDANTGDPYALANDPTVTFTFFYTAG